MQQTDQTTGGSRTDPPRILLVEDEQIVALELEHRLVSRGFSVVGLVSSTEEALECVARERVDLALVDILLAGSSDGIELAKRLRELDIPVVFLTAHDDEQTLQRVKSAHAQAYLLKPFDERLLYLTIETALHRHAAERERLHAEQALRAAKALEAAILEHSPDAILVLGDAQQIVLSNVAAHELFGASAQLLARLQLRELFPERGYEQLLPAEAARGGRARARRVDGGELTVELRSSFLPLDGGERLILVVRDVSEQARLEQQLSRARQLEVAGRVASGVAHDLNNLLSIVWMSSYMLRRSSGEGRPQLLDELESAVKLGAAMTTRLLSLAGRVGAKRERVVINDALRTMSGLVSRCMAKGVELVLELDPRVGALHMDPVQLDVCIMNLTLNASHAMPQGGCLKIRSRVLEDSEPGGSSSVLLEIEDEGEGMNAQTQRRLFEPFFTTRPESGGMGLGLWIVKGIVDAEGGELEFDSELGRGTCFRIKLPKHLSLTPREAEPRRPQPSGLAGEGRHVLLVDDDEVHRSALGRVLDSEGFRPLHAGGAGEALLIVERGARTPCAAIVDVELPYMDGFELREGLQRLLPGLPVLLISGSAASTLGVERSGEEVLPKPLRAERMLEALAGLLAEGGP